MPDKKPFGKMPNILSDDILYEIFKLLKDNESYGNSLYQCLHVNRLWCRLSTPFLWRSTILKETKPNIFITTYVSCLSSNERFSTWLSNEERSMLSSKGLFVKPPLFEYESYLREFSFKSLDKAVRDWFDCVYGSEDLKDPKKDAFIRKLELCLFKMFAERSVLETIAIELEVENCWSILEVERSKISNIKNLSISFPSAKDVSKVKKFLLNLRQIFQNLDEVCFFVDEAGGNNELISQSSKEIIAFIKCQKSLKGFNLIGEEDKFLYVKEVILSSLKSHANSLVHLNIDNVSFQGMSLSNFERCSKLESLGMGYCSNLLNTELDSKFSNLRKLELSLNQFGPKIIPSILKKAGESLIELDIDDITPEIEEILVSDCNKIESLSISGNAGNNNLSLSWLSKLRNLKRLEFMQVKELLYSEWNASEVENLPKNVKIMKIITELFTPKDFDCFYESTSHLDFSLISIIFSPEVKDFKDVSYNDPKSFLEITINSSGGVSSDDIDYKQITLKKKRSNDTLSFRYLKGKLSEKEE